MTDWTIHQGDCIAGMADLEPGCVDLTVTSIPFGSLFMYSGKTEDIGNNEDGVDLARSFFGAHLRFWAERLYRVHKPGTLAAIHIQQLVTYAVQHGYQGRRDLRGALIDVMGAAGFEWHAEISIPKDPQVIAQRQKLHSLLFATGYRDSSKLAPAVNDFCMVFRRPGEREPIPALHHPSKNPGGWVTQNEWIRWARGTWDDIRETDVLEGWKLGRDEDDEKHVCLARGSLVLTYDGYRPIDELEIGDRVLTHEGRWRRVTAKACNGVKPVVQTHAQGVARLRTTPDHKLWTRSVGDAPVHRHRRVAEVADPGWVPAEETKASYVNLKLPPVEESPYSAEEWWIVGRWLGDGHFDSRGRAHISCGKHEADALIERLGSFAGAPAQRRTGVQVPLNDRGGRLRALLQRCGRGAGGKRVPGEAIALAPEKAEALLDGYLSADGHYVAKYERWTASSVSRALVLGMALVAQRARGVVASVYAGRPAGTAEIEGRTVNTRADWILSIPPRNVSGLMLDDGAWKKVRKIEPQGEVEVWDISVEEDASFTAEGCVVKNCPLQLDVVRRCVKLWSNPGEVVFDPFAGIGTVPYVAVEEGRQGLGFELKESYHRQAVKNLERVASGGSAQMSIEDALGAAA